VLFVMLTGRPFFPRAPEAELRGLAADRSWVRQRLRWACRRGLSTHAQDLLTSMLRHDRHQRPTVREALYHPFLASSHVQESYSDSVVRQAEDVLQRLPADCLAFSREPVLKRAALLLLAHLGAHDFTDTQPQRLAFSVIDWHADGELSIEAVEGHYGRAGGLDDIPDDLEDAFHGVDVNRDGYINYVEFLSATLPKSVRRNERLCREVFDMLDHGGDGHIDAADLAAAFRTSKDRESVCARALEEVCGPEGRLSWPAFRELLRG